MDRKYNVEEYLKVWEETEKGLEVVVNDNFELKKITENSTLLKSSHHIRRLMRGAVR